MMENIKDLLRFFLLKLHLNFNGKRKNVVTHLLVWVSVTCLKADCEHVELNRYPLGLWVRIPCSRLPELVFLIFWMITCAELEHCDHNAEYKQHTRETSW